MLQCPTASLCFQFDAPQQMQAGAHAMIDECNNSAVQHDDKYPTNHDLMSLNMTTSGSTSCCTTRVSLRGSARASWKVSQAALMPYKERETTKTAPQHALAQHHFSVMASLLADSASLSQGGPF
jgi:hypothetical protein